MKWLSAFKTNGEHWNMKLPGTRDRTVAQRRGTEIDPKHDRVTADMHPLPREVDLFGPLRYRPVDETSLDAAGDQEPIPSIAAPDYRAKAGADKSWRRQKLAQTKAGTDMGSFLVSSVCRHAGWLTPATGEIQ
jgi:hypothetical protein